MKQILKLLTITGVVLAIILIYCHYNYQFWTHSKTKNFEALVEYKGKNIKGLRGRQILVHKEFEKHMEQIDRYAINNKVKLIINQSYRHDKQSLSHTVVEPGKLSNHLAGFAIDFNIISKGTKYFSNDLKRDNLNNLPGNVLGFINDIRKSQDLRWGGDFNREDPIHIDHPLNLKNRNKWDEYKNNCALDYSNRIPKWKIWR